jgi:hypothetical protein
VDVPVAGSGARPLHCLREPIDEGEAALPGFFLGPMRDDEERYRPGVPAAPVVGRLVGPAAADDSTQGGRDGIEVLLVGSGQFAARPPGIRPRAPEDPVVKPLTAVAEAAPGTVVRPGDIPIDRRRGPAITLPML